MKPGERARRARQFERLRLLAEMVCESNSRHDDGDVTRMLDTMMRVILQVRPKRMNNKLRRVLADHLNACPFGGDPTVMLGGDGERDMIHLDGAFDIAKLSERMIWTENTEGGVLLDRAGRRIN